MVSSLIRRSQTNLRVGVVPVNKITTGANVEIGVRSPDVGCVCEARRCLLSINDALPFYRLSIYLY